MTAKRWDGPFRLCVKSEGMSGVHGQQMTPDRHASWLVGWLVGLLHTDNLLMGVRCPVRPVGLAGLSQTRFSEDEPAG